MKIYEDDALFIMQKLAMRDLQKYIAKHPELELQFDEQQAIFRRAFHPKWVVKFAKRCLDRGHTFVRGSNPVRRLTAQRHMNRLLRGLHYTIEKAKERWDGSHQ